MPLPFWAHAVIWSVFGVVALLPPLVLAVEALAGADLAYVGATLLSGDAWRLLLTSTGIATGSALVALLFGAPLAMLCERTDLPGVRWWRLAALVPLLIPPFMHALVWNRLLAPTGTLDQILRSHLGLGAPDIHTPLGVSLVLGLAYFPFVFLLCSAGLRSVDRRLEEAGLVRSGPTWVWLRIILPLIFPYLLSGGLFVFVFALVEFSTADILRVQTYPLEIFIQFSALFDETAAVALGLPMLAVSLLAIAGITVLMGGRGYVSLGADREAAVCYRLGGWRWWGLGFCGVLIGLGAVVPMVDLVSTAGTPDVFFERLTRSGGEILMSVFLALVAAVSTTLLGMGLALSLSGLKPRRRQAWGYVAQLPFGVAPILLGIGLILVWNRPQASFLYGTTLILVVGYMAHFVPFAFRAAEAALRQVAPDQIHAARLAAGSRAAVLKVILPLTRNGLLAAALIVFVLALSELGTSLLVTPPGVTPIPISIYNLMHYGADDSVAALCLILLSIQLTVGVLVLAAAHPRRAAR